VKELINDLSRSKCLKALVTGAADQELELIPNKSNIAKKNFDVIITGDDWEEGKPDPTPFQAALQRLGTEKPSEAVVVENSPLGVEAANKAGIPCIVTLNTSLLKISDFKDIISEDRIFKDTKTAGKFLRNWCCI
jgi:beta-phosphoglucomutase